MLKCLKLHRNLNSLYFQHKALAEEPTNRAFEASYISILTGEVSEKTANSLTSETFERPSLKFHIQEMLKVHVLSRRMSYLFPLTA